MFELFFSTSCELLFSASLLRRTTTRAETKGSKLASKIEVKSKFGVKRAARFGRRNAEISEEADEAKANRFREVTAEASDSPAYNRVNISNNKKFGKQKIVIFHSEIEMLYPGLEPICEVR